MEDNRPAVTNYLKNTKTSNDRTIRIEVVGEMSEAEKHFLDGISFFVAGTLSKNDLEHTTYVSEMMTKLIKHIVGRMRNKKPKEDK